jgi:hypothetical protein
MVPVSCVWVFGVFMTPVHPTTCYKFSASVCMCSVGLLQSPESYNVAWGA